MERATETETATERDRERLRERVLHELERGVRDCKAARWTCPAAGAALLKIAPKQTKGKGTGDDAATISGWGCLLIRFDLRSAI